MDDGKAGLCRERSRERALARAGHAGDDDAAANGKRKASLAHCKALMVCLSVGIADGSAFGGQRQR